MIIIVILAMVTITIVVIKNRNYENKENDGKRSKRTTKKDREQMGSLYPLLCAHMLAPEVSHR